MQTLAWSVSFHSQVLQRTQTHTNIQDLRCTRAPLANPQNLHVIQYSAQEMMHNGAILTFLTLTADLNKYTFVHGVCHFTGYEGSH